MPRSAATIIGLALVALSIGFNTMRYPVVWDMVSVAPPSDRREPASAIETEEPLSVAVPAPASLPSQPVKPIELTPASQAAESVVSGPQANDPTAYPEAGNAASSRPQPLVPLVPIGLEGRASGDVADGERLQRLPPVTQDSLPMVAGDAIGSIPIYPTTGIE